MAASTNKSQREAWTARQIASAVSYTAVMFLGFPDGYDRREASSLEEARAIRSEMLTEYEGKNYGRGVMIYAITPGYAMTIHVE